MRKAANEFELYIDLRAMDCIRRESKKRLEGQTVLMEKADNAVKPASLSLDEWDDLRDARI